jgi:GNAT superfamily N-acetyltransferase
MRLGPLATKIRSASPDEAEILATLHVTTWQQAYAGLLPNDYLLSLTPQQRLPMWQQLLDSPERVAIFVADQEGTPIGFSCGGISNDEDARPTTGEMWSIYLLRKFWGKGIGSSLHDVLIDELEGR